MTTPVMLHPFLTSDFPIAPPDIAVRGTNKAGQAVLLVLIALGCVAIYALALRFKLRYDTWLPLQISLGATFSALIEPLPDAVANLWYYTPGQTSIYHSYGNAMPVWTFLSYTMWYGGFGMLLWWLIERGATRRRIAQICVPLAIYLGGGEIFFIHALHLYTYHGPAAFKVWGYPAWIPLLNTSIVMLIGAGTARLRRSIPAADQAFPAFLLPSVAVVIGLLVEPMAVWTTIHSTNPSTGLVWLTTIIAIALALGVMRTALRMFPVEGFAPMEPVVRAVAAPADAPARAIRIPSEI